MGALATDPETTMQSRILGAFLGATACCLLGACHSDNAKPDGAQGNAPTGKTASAAFISRPDSPISGTVTFTQEGNKVHAVAILGGTPMGVHGFHIHEKGDCTAADFSSAGEHFNPGHKDHACPPGEAHHAGDFGNIEIGKDGTGRIEITTDQLSVGDGANSVVGKSIVLHEQKDDCSSQPAGNSGKRIACATIQVK